MSAECPKCYMPIVDECVLCRLKEENKLMRVEKVELTEMLSKALEVIDKNNECCACRESLRREIALLRDDRIKKFLKER